MEEKGIRIAAVHFLGHARRELVHVKTAVEYAGKNHKDLEEDSLYKEVLICLFMLEHNLMSLRLGLINGLKKP